jgi:hypothetical protein
MSNRLMFRPDLADCVLEDRALLAIANLGLIIQTTSGLALITPFPGANSSGAGSLGSNGSGGGTASAVSGLPIPTSFYITGSGGLSSLRPGNITGLPSLAGGAGAGGGLTVSFQVGSGSDTATGPNGNSNTQIVTRFTFADPLTPTTFSLIGGMSTSTNSPVLPPGQSYRDTAPVPPPAPMGVINQPATGAGMGFSTGDSMPNPQLGAPRLGPFNSNHGLTGPVPGSLVPVSPVLPGSN